MSPGRTAGGGRRYSHRDIELLREVQRLSQDDGVNRAGIRRIIELESQVDALRSRIGRAHRAGRRTAGRSAGGPDGRRQCRRQRDRRAAPRRGALAATEHRDRRLAPAAPITDHRPPGRDSTQAQLVGPDHHSGVAIGGPDQHQVRDLDSWHRCTVLELPAHAVLPSSPRPPELTGPSPRRPRPPTCRTSRSLATVAVLVRSRLRVRRYLFELVLLKSVYQSIAHSREHWYNRTHVEFRSGRRVDRDTGRARHRRHRPRTHRRDHRPGTTQGRDQRPAGPAHRHVRGVATSGD